MTAPDQFAQTPKQPLPKRSRPHMLSVRSVFTDRAEGRGVLYKRMSRFMQSELGISHQENSAGVSRSKKQNKTKRRPLKQKAPRPSKEERDANRAKEIAELGLSSAYLMAIGPLISSLEGKPKQIAHQLNSRGVKAPNGQVWNGKSVVLLKSALKEI